MLSNDIVLELSAPTDLRPLVCLFQPNAGGSRLVFRENITSTPPQVVNLYTHTDCCLSDGGVPRRSHALCPGVEVEEPAAKRARRRADPKGIFLLRWQKIGKVI